MNDVLLISGFIGFVILMLVIDLKFFHAEAHTTTTREAATWVGVWVGLAVVFGVIMFFWQGPQKSAEYFAGYLIEYSLSVDNMFVFIVIFSYFAVPAAYQHKVLFYGILGAIISRGVFIALGATLIHNFEWIVYVFGGLLLLTAVKIARGTEHVDPARNPVLRVFRKLFRTSPNFEGQKLFTVVNGKRMATPLLVVLIVIETTDIAFAIDSIPAIFAVTKDPFIVLTSNVFAILGLRALYFVIAGSLERLHLLKYGLAVILVFVGVKMLLTAVPCEGSRIAGIVTCSEGHLHVPILVSLAVIVLVLLTTAGLSLAIKPKPTSEIHVEDLPAEDLPK